LIKVGATQKPSQQRFPSGAVRQSAFSRQFWANDPWPAIMATKAIAKNDRELMLFAMYSIQLQ